MGYWIYGAIIPLLAIAIVVVIYKSNVTRGLTKIYLPLITYMLLIYTLENESYINSGYAFLTLFMGLFPYTLLILILNLIAWYKRRRVNS
jgi:hypothetical protein